MDLKGEYSLSWVGMAGKTRAITHNDYSRLFTQTNSA